MTKRNLDGYFFRITRDGKNDDVCFSDLTHIEREEVLQKFDKDALIRMCIGLGDALEYIGNMFNIEYVEYQLVEESNI